jgi:ribosomal protein S12 methylthiotransferase
MQVLIDRIDGGIAIARSSSDAPEIDGTVRIAVDKAAAARLTVGSMAEVQITGAGQYDLDARLLN